MTVALILITAAAAVWLIRQWWRAELEPTDLRPSVRAARLSRPLARRR